MPRRSVLPGRRAETPIGIVRLRQSPNVSLGLSRLASRRKAVHLIGCGTEPALHKGFSGIARLAKEYKIPFVGFTSNGQLLKEDDIEGFIECKLDELTLFDIDEVTRYNAGWWGNHAAKYDVIS